MNETCAGRWAAGALSLLAAVLLGCGWAPPGRVLVIGIDGATLRVAGPLLAEDRLPNLARIAEAGASGKLKSFRPLFSPRIWTTIATGKTPAKHGIAGFTFRDDDDEQRLYLSVHRESAALWNIVSEAGGVVGVVNWWNTYPPEIVRGVLVSDHAKPHRVAELSKLTGVEAEKDEGAPVFPPQWSARVAAAYDATDTLTDFANPFEGDHGLARWMRARVLAKRFYEDESAVRVALEIERETRPDLMMVFLPGIDRVSHHLWGTLEPAELYPTALRPTPSQREAGANALRAYYAYTDALIGRLVEPFGPDDLVIVVSDHGFEPGLHLGTLTGIHDSVAAEDGVMFMRGPGVPAGTDTDGVTVNDIAPTVLAWFGLPLGEDMDGQVVAFLEHEPVEPIPTHDVKAIEYLDAVPSGREDEILDQLRDLGYIE